MRNPYRFLEDYTVDGIESNGVSKEIVSLA